MLVQGVRALFLANGSITALVPAQTVKGISTPAVFCDAPMQGILPPFVVIHSNALNPVQTLDGTKMETLEIDAVAYTEPAARTLSKTVTDYFEAFIGAVTADAVSDTITGVFPQDKTYSYVFPQEGRDTKYHVVTTESEVYYT